MLILHIISGLNDGGAEGVLYRLCSNDRNNRHVVICLSDSGKYGSMLSLNGIDVHYLSIKQGSINFMKIFWLWRLIRRIQPTIVHTWMYHANVLGGICARLAGVSAVVWGIRSSLLEVGKSKPSSILLMRLSAYLSWFVPKSIVCCAVCAADVHASIGYNASKIVVIANGFSLSELKPDPDSGERIRSNLAISKCSLILGMVGRFDSYKDHFNLLQALALLKMNGIKFKCLLVGSGLTYENIQLNEWVASCSLVDDLYLLGHQTNINEMMNVFDFHVLSSCSEAFPNVIAEAMACGTPCITTDVGDAALIVGDTGWVVPISNPVALAHTIKIATEESLSQRLRRGHMARHRIATFFSLDSMVIKYSDHYRTIIKSS